jgi:hypothetical protein
MYIDGTLCCVSDKMFLVFAIIFFLLQGSHCQDFADDIKNIFSTYKYAMLKNLYDSRYSSLSLGSYELISV